MWDLDESPITMKEGRDKFQKEWIIQKNEWFLYCKDEYGTRLSLKVTEWNEKVKGIGDDIRWSKNRIGIMELVPERRTLRHQQTLLIDRRFKWGVFWRRERERESRKKLFILYMYFTSTWPVEGQRICCFEKQRLEYWFISGLECWIYKGCLCEWRDGSITFFIGREKKEKD